MKQQDGRPVPGLRIVAVSGGPDSVYLLHRCRTESAPVMIAHFNHMARGVHSREDQRLVERMSRELGIPLETGRAGAIRGPGIGGKGTVRGFERKAREARYRFLFETRERVGGDRILVGHTADDQVETVLMRVLEGAGIAGLKGIPRSTGDGIERPLLGVWREEILAYLERHRIPYRMDRSNRDTRFERNWVRHVLLPLLEGRYGKPVKRRLLALGERFREMDAYVEREAERWMTEHNVAPRRRKTAGVACTTIARIPREAFACLPAMVRMKILQVLCFRRIGMAPNERLLASMDRLLLSGGPSARVSVGKGFSLRCRYGNAILSGPEREKGEKERGSGSPRPGNGKRRPPILQMKGTGTYPWEGNPRAFQWEERPQTGRRRVFRSAKGERVAFFDGKQLSRPLVVRRLQAGDRIRPFGLAADKKVKEILIDRKVPREERWGRAVVCDAAGTVLWIPGILRSDHAPVTGATRRVVVLRAEIPGMPSA